MSKKNNRGLNVIIYHKAYPDGRIVYVEEVRGKRRGELAFVSMRKYKQKNGRLPNEAEASTLGSSTINDGKDNTNIPNTQEKPEKNNQPSFSVDDSDYMDAVEKGDMESADKMVKEPHKGTPYYIRYNGQFSFMTASELLIKGFYDNVLVKKVE